MTSPLEQCRDALRNFIEGCSTGIDAGAVGRAALAAADAALAAQPEPVAWASSDPIRINQLVSAAQYKSALPKNRVDFDVPLYAAPVDAPVAQPLTDERVIAGALFDFLGYLTTRDEVTPMGSTALATPAVDLLSAWAKTRNLHLDDADVMGWRHGIEPKHE